MKFYKKVNACPWCGSEEAEALYKLREEGEALKCRDCGLVYASRVLTGSGLKDYWDRYESEEHTADSEKADKRREMYKMDYHFIRPFLAEGSRILDVGCGNGEFLDLFQADGFECEGTEYGQEAFELSSAKYKVYHGDMAELDIKKKYDLISFRGVIQYLLHPKEGFRRAASLLNDRGKIYITASPNSESLCFRYFLDKFTLPVTAEDYYMFSEKILTEYMADLGMKLAASGNLYLGTPYEDYADDILKVAKAVECRKAGKEVTFRSPAFFDNMLTLVYQKMRSL